MYTHVICCHGVFPASPPPVTMFHVAAVLTCGIVSLLLGATFYAKYGDSLYQHKTPLLSRFPLHATHCCDNGCNSMFSYQQYIIIMLIESRYYCTDPISQGYMLESYDTKEDEFLSYLAFATVKVFSKIFFYNHNITLWRGEV